MIARLRSIFCPSCYKYSTIISLNWAKSYRNIKVNIQDFSLFSFVIYIIKGYNLLIKLKKMNFICPNFFHLFRITVILFIYHTNSSLLVVISHRQLRISIETYVLLLVDPDWWTYLGASYQIVTISFSLFSLITNSIVAYTFSFGCCSLKQKFMNLNVTIIHY
jgi:hypothetical protein